MLMLCFERILLTASSVSVNLSLDSGGSCSVSRKHHNHHPIVLANCVSQAALIQIKYTSIVILNLKLTKTEFHNYTFSSPLLRVMSEQMLI